ncbi:MAG: NUDIX hydrolase [Anaerolineales bacterium]|nr:NUDIX hydrolase [Anaerolineales bacterium]
MTPRVLKSEIVFRGRAFGVRLDEVEYAPGRTTRIEVVEHVGAVTMLPLDDDGRLWFIRQYRHSIGETLLELPAGTLHGDEDPALGAQRELQEEIGMRAARLEPLTTFWLAPGYSTEKMYAYLATGLTPAPLPQDADEMIEVIRLPVAEALAAVERGEVRDAKSLATLFAAARRLGW